MIGGMNEGDRSHQQRSAFSSKETYGRPATERPASQYLREPMQAASSGPPGRRGRLTDGIDSNSIFQVHSVPKQPDTPNRQAEDIQTDNIKKVLTTAHRDGRQIVVVWNREQQNGNIGFFIGGIPVIEDQTTGQNESTLLYPPGGLGSKSEDLEAKLAQFPYWVKITGRPRDFMPTEREKQHTPNQSLSDLFNFFTGTGTVVFQASPVPKGETVNNAKSKNLDLSSAQSAAANNESQKPKAARLQREFEELNEAVSIGGWNVNVFVGAESQEKLGLLASMVTAYTDVGDLPITLEPVWKTRPYNLSQALEDTTEDTTNVMSINSGTLARFASPPRQEIPGVSVVEPTSLSVNFTESHPEEKNNIEVGRVLDNYLRPLNQIVTLNRKILNRSVGIWGIPGSGKTELALKFLADLTNGEDAVPMIIFAPAKAQELRVIGSRVNKPVRRIRPGESGEPMIGINPFQPEYPWQLASHMSNTLDLLTGAFLDSEEGRGLWNSYAGYGLNGNEEYNVPGIFEMMGWIPETGRSHPRMMGGEHPYPTMRQFRTALLTVLERAQYAKGLNNMDPFLKRNILDISQGAVGNFLNPRHPLSIPELLSGRTIFELDGITHKQHQAYIIGSLLTRIREFLEVEQATEGTVGQKKLRLVIFIDEVQDILPKVPLGAQNFAGDAMVREMRLIRSKGGCFILAGQMPEAIDDAAVKLPATQVLLNMVDEKDYKRIGAAMGMSLTERDMHNLTFVPGFKPGEALFHTEGMRHGPIAIQTFDPTNLPNDMNHILPPDGLIEPSALYGYGEEFAERASNIEEIIRSKNFLNETVAGLLVQQLVYAKTVATLLGLGDVRLRDDLIVHAHSQIFEDYGGTADFTPVTGRRISSQAIQEAVVAEVDSRLPEILRYMPDANGKQRKKLINYLAKSICDQMYGEDTGELSEQENNYAFPPFRNPKVHIRLMIADLAENQPEQDLGDIFGAGYKGLTARQYYEHMEKKRPDQELSTGQIEELLFNTILSLDQSPIQSQKQQDYKFRIEALTDIKLEQVQVTNEGPVDWMNKFIKLLENFELDEGTRQVLTDSADRVARKYRLAMEKQAKENEFIRSQQFDMRQLTALEEQAKNSKELNQMTREYWQYQIGKEEQAKIVYD